MSFGTLWDIAISMSFLYLFLSLVCTSINETIAILLKLRSRSLSAGLEKILEDEALIKRFYANGLVKGQIAAAQRGKRRLEGVPAPTRHSSYLNGRTFAMALLASLNPDKPLPIIADIEDSLKKACLPSGVRDILASALATAKDDMTALRNELAAWFDMAMDRVGDEYKRRITWISFGVGLALAVILNVDSFSIAKDLWQDQGLREQLAQAAATYLRENPASCPLPAAATLPSTPQALAQALSSGLDCRLDSMNDALDQVRPFPIDWDTDPATAPRHPSAVFFQPLLWLEKTLGWLFTAAALSLGAPLWFDTLSKFMNIRGAGRKPDKTVRT